MKMTSKKNNLNELAINTIRMLGVEMIQKANSGHPGIVLGAAPMMYALFKNHLNVYQKDLNFINRDRFILSAGHGSALLYATMLLAEYPSLSMDDIKNFRQINAKTAGHPEKHLLSGVDFGTGPLGQGAATSVGFAIAEANMNARFSTLIDHYTYCILGDGCLQEGVTHEALAIAGRYKLHKLIWLFDSNDVQLDGKVSDSTTTDYAKLVAAHGWDYLLVKNGMDHEAINQAITKAKNNKKPTFIECKTILGYGSTVANSHKAHGSPISAEGIKKLRDFFKYPHEPFAIDQSLQSHFKPMWARGEVKYKKYEKNLKTLESQKPDLYNAYYNQLNKKLNFSLADLDDLKIKDVEASRNIAGEVFKIVSSLNPNVMVLNNDLSGSTKIKSANKNNFDFNNYSGQNINVGVREFLATAICAGIVAHGGLLAITSTFMSFADYCKPALRLAAINQIPIVCLFSHDSISVGEDGPTHQPVEQLTMLRTIPNVNVYRPANLFECYHAFHQAFISDFPSVIVTSRSGFTQSQPVDIKANGLQPYFVYEPQGKPEFLIFATGSEVGLGIDLAKRFQKDQIHVGVLSIPNMNIFWNEQNPFFKLIKKLANHSVLIEAGSPYLWKQFFKHVIGINQFGISGKSSDVSKYLNFDEDCIYKKISDIFGNKAN